MKGLLLLSFLFAAVLALTEVDYQNEFLGFMKTYQKSYHHDQFRIRYGIFKDNLDAINAHNAGKSSFTMAMNQFGDLTNEEFNRLFKGLQQVEFADITPTLTILTDDPPAEWDWRNSTGQQVVTAIKDQKQCGSCWAFSTTGSTEGCHALSTGNLVSLSEQNLMDCSTSYGNDGCDGGLMTQAMTYIIQNNGIDTEASYPYQAADGTCQYNAANSGATLSSFVNVNQGDENDLLTKVYKGPTSVAIDASHQSFQFYSKGVYSEPKCSSVRLDHGVLAIGYGTYDGTDYWLVKNSWGTTWGLEGYIMMSRNANNQCGIATMATLPQC